MAGPQYPHDPAAYKLIAEVGQGATAVVYRALCTACEKEVAVKIIDLENTNMAIEQFQREITIMLRSSHRNVLRLLATFIHGNGIWLILEYHPYGSVADVLKTTLPNGFEDERIVTALLYQALQALSYFHENSQMHRDVKAANLLIASGGEVRMGDFGVSGEAPSCRRSMTRLTFVGTPCWMAPEVLTLKGYRKSADIWSLGITALELAFGQPPYAHHPPMKVLALTLKAEPPTVDQCRRNSFSPPFKRFVSQCLQKDPTARPTAAQLLHDPLFEEFRAGAGVAAEAVHRAFSRWEIPELEQRPVAPKAKPGGGGAADDDAEWDFPALPGAVATALGADAPAWRHECQRVHSVSMAAYTKSAQLYQAERLTTFSAQCVRSGRMVTFHELELEKEKYTEPVLKDGVVDSVLAVDHPGVLSCHEIWEDGVSGLYWITDSKHGGTLAQYIRQVGALPPEVARAFSYTVASALKRSHDDGLTLKRLSALSIVMANGGDGAPQPKIDLPAIVLTSATFKDPDAQAAEAYMPPEQFDDSYSNKVDVYALAMVVLEMVSGRPPYGECRNPMRLVQQKVRGKPPESLACLPPALKEWQDFITRLGNPEPAQRPDAAEVLQAPVFDACRAAPDDAGEAAPPAPPPAGGGGE